MRRPAASATTRRADIMGRTSCLLGFGGERGEPKQPLGKTVSCAPTTGWLNRLICESVASGVGESVPYRPTAAPVNPPFDVDGEAIDPRIGGGYADGQVGRSSRGLFLLGRT